VSKVKGKGSILDDGSDVLLEPIEPIQPGDPLYDELDSAEDYVLVSGDVDPCTTAQRSYDPDHSKVVFGPRMTLSEFKRQIISTLEEYFHSEDVEDTIRSLRELSCPEYHHEIVKRSISLSLDRNDRERELVSKLLNAAHPSLLAAKHLQTGFTRLFEIADELEIDVPGAIANLAAFLARAVVDEILPPSFLIDPIVSGLGGDIIEDTKRILSREHQYSRVEKIWGPGDGRPVPEMKVAVDALVEEFLVSRDYAEAERCVRELHAPHFHHEVVKRAIVVVIDRDRPIHEACVSLLEHLAAQEVISRPQLRRGLERIETSMEDIMLDSPKGKEVFDFIRNALEEKGILETDDSHV